MSNTPENTVRQSVDEGYQAVALEIGKSLEQAQARISELETELAAKEGTIADSHAAIDRAAAEAARQVREATDRAELAEAHLAKREALLSELAWGRREQTLLVENADLRKQSREALARAEAAEAALGSLDTVFRSGDKQAEIDWDNDAKTECAYADGTPERHWWTRGYSYKWRALRTVAAEERERGLRKALESLWIEHPLDSDEPDTCAWCGDYYPSHDADCRIGDALSPVPPGAQSGERSGE